MLLVLISTTAFPLAGQVKIDPTAYPYAYVVKLLMYKSGSSYHGTGIMINENSIITNAHNVHGKDSILVYPGYSKGDKAPFGFATVRCKPGKNIFYPKEYEVDSLHRFYDFAVMKFQNVQLYDRVLQSSGGKFFDLGWEEDLRSESLNISGYPYFRWFELWKPRSARVHYHNTTNQYSISEVVLLNYRLGTRGGSSGSPLWIEKNGRLIVIGIHKSGSGFHNQGIYYDSERLRLLNGWVDL